jgi:hypothetical protein
MKRSNPEKWIEQGEARRICEAAIADRAQRAARRREVALRCPTITGIWDAVTHRLALAHAVPVPVRVASRLPHRIWR